MPEQLNFGWPTQKSEPTPEDVVTTVKNIIHTVMNKTKIEIDTTTPKSSITDSPTTIMPGIVDSAEKDAETTQNILTTVVDTMTTTARNIVSTISNNIESATTSSATGNSFNLTQSVDSNRTGIVTSNNSTVLTEVLGSNNTVNENGSTIDSMLENITTEVNNVTEALKDIIITATDKAIGIKSDVTNTTVMTQTDIYQPENTYHDESLTVYVVLGLLLGILILIFIALLIIYRKYKKCRQGSGDYCVTQLKEIQSSSSIKSTSDLEDVHVKH